MPCVVASIKVRVGQRERTTDWRRHLTVDLRTRLGRAPGGELVEDPFEALRREILVVVVIDLRHRRVHAGGEALDFDPGELSVRGDVMLVTDAALADRLECIR